MNEQLPDFVIGRAGARMMDVIAGLEDDVQRELWAEAFTSAQIVAREDGEVQVVGFTDDGPEVMGRFEGHTVGVFVVDGRLEFRE